VNRLTVNALRAIEEEMHRLRRYQTVPLFYDPIDYMLDLGGKKIRPLLLWLSCGMCGASPERALPAAAAVELLHDFSLVHDDIMDNDATRRGKPTIHVKWDVNTAILSGDGLLGFAFQKLLETDCDDTAELARVFTRAMIIICEGQGLDKQFEEQEEVTPAAYLDMIRRKTATLIEVSCELGGMIAGADDATLEQLRRFGLNLGMAFQMQDDMLDITADEAALGKKVGSDFEMHKRTILYLMLRERLDKAVFDALDLAGYRRALNEAGILAAVQKQTEDYFDAAWRALEHFPASPYKSAVGEMLSSLQKRRY